MMVDGGWRLGGCGCLKEKDDDTARGAQTHEAASLSTDDSCKHVMACEAIATQVKTCRFASDGLKE